MQQTINKLETYFQAIESQKSIEQAVAEKQPVWEKNGRYNRK